MTGPSPTQVRRAFGADLDTLVAFRVALFRELEQGPEESSLARFEAACRDAIGSAMTSEHCLAWLAESPRAEAVGSLIMLIFPRLPSPRDLGGREGYVLSVYTSPAWRGRGVASALLSAAAAEAAQNGLARIRLHTTAAGRPVYQRAGYRARTDEMELWLAGNPPG